MYEEPRMDLKALIRDVPDFPKPGILFRDITPLLQHPKALAYVTDALAERVVAAKADVIIGVESRGFIFGAPIAVKLGLPFVPVRKPGKLPAACMSVEYSLEYGSSRLDIHQDAITPGQRVAIIDDLLATGGTAKAAAKLVELLKGEVALFLFAIELSFLNGREQLAGYKTEALLTY